MQRVANVYLAGTDGNLLNPLIEDFSQNNYSVLVFEQPSELMTVAPSSQPDLIVIDAGDDSLSPMGLARNLSTTQETCNIPIVLFNGDGTRGFYQDAREIGAAEIFVGLPSTEEFFRRISPLLRLSTMRAELYRRANLAAKHDIAGDISHAYTADTSPMKILIVDLPEMTLQRVKDVLGNGAELSIASNAIEAEEILDDSFFDAVLTGIGDDPEDCLNFCAYLRSNPRLFNLPVAVTGRDGEISADDRVKLYRRGATRVLAEPFADAEFETALFTMVQRQRARWRIRGIIESIKTGPVKDEVTGLYAAEYQLKHLENLIDIAAEWNKHLTLAVFSISNAANVRTKFGDAAADELLKQAGQWIDGMVRVEDMTAKTGDHEFSVIFTDTSKEEAQIVVNRIAGIVSYTDFAITDVFQPLSAIAEVGIAELSEGDTAQSLSDRAKSHLE